MTCRCASTPCSCSVPTPLAECDPTPTDPPVPVRDIPIACTLLGRLQAQVDRARAFSNNVLGTNEYQVRLVWQEQDPVTGKWTRVYEREVAPVNVDGREQLEDLAGGQVPTGSITLREISPRLFNEDLLRGYIDGQPWTGPTREFFYEVQQKPWCSTSRDPQRYRFVLSGVPEHRATNHEWRVTLVAQFGRRERDGTDSTVPGEFFAGDGAQIMS